MKLTSKFKENEVFEKDLRNSYPENVCDIIIDWVEEALRYVFKKSNVDGQYILGEIDLNTEKIKFSNIKYSYVDIFECVMDEMQHAIDDEDNESREDIKEELRALSEAL